MSTVFITGTSSGIGYETAKLFQSKGWNVIATMRTPKEDSLLNTLPNVKVLQCDVTNDNSIKKAVADGINSFNGIDVFVNNAGFYTIGTFEAATNDEIERQINTNLVGLIKITKEIIPHFRAKRSGVIINVSSMAGIITVPLQSIYHATKWGVEGFSESLQYELRKFNIKIKIVEPGIVKTDFYGRSMVVTKNTMLNDYDEYTKNVLEKLINNGENGSDPSGAAQTIFKAATDKKFKLRYPTGNSKELVYLRKILPTSLFRRLVQKTME